MIGTTKEIVQGFALIVSTTVSTQTKNIYAQQNTSIAVNEHKQSEV